MTSLNPQQSTTMKARLRERAAQLRNEIQHTLERSSDETHVRIAEQARDTEDDSFSNLIVDLNLAEIDRDADELRRIDTALARISEGSYGLCESCGQGIPEARLQAEPTALRCVQCQELYERTHAGNSHAQAIDADCEDLATCVTRFFMRQVFICDAIRTPIGRYGGTLAGIRPDDLGAIPLHALMQRNPRVDWAAVDDVYFGCANQAGEDNRNVARMSALLAGLPDSVPGATINRLCGSGLDAVNLAARSIRAGEAELAIAGGVESMTRAPFVMGKADSAFSRTAKIEDTTIGWRFVNPLMKAKYGIDSMPETAENVAQEFSVARADQDKFALRSQQRYARALAAKFFESELVPVSDSAEEG